MGQLDFFICKEEKIEMVDFCLERGFRFVPSMHYEDNAYLTITDLEGYLKYYDKSWLFFLIHPDYTLYPLQMRSFEKEGLKRYFIDQRYGGPTIDFYSPSLAEIEDNKIGPGFISIYPFYYHSGQQFNSSPSIKEMYKMISDFIKRRSVRIKIQKRNYWVGAKTIELFKEGELEMVEFPDTKWKDILM